MLKAITIDHHSVQTSIAKIADLETHALVEQRLAPAVAARHY
jgi:hypothetical protein